MSKKSNKSPIYSLKLDNLFNILKKTLKKNNKYVIINVRARVAELVDAADSKSAGSNILWVRFPSLAPVRNLFELFEL